MRHPVVFVLLALAAGGCSVFEEKKIDYKSLGGARLPTLEVPPDLVVPASDNRYAVPDVNPAGSATFSAYDKARADKPKAAGEQALLPRVDRASIERAGTQRWLLVQAPAVEVWSVVKDFWQENGFIITLEQPDTGVLETDWAENRSKVPQEGIRKWIGKAMDNIYSTGERDKFRTRLESTAGSNATEIYVSHRGMVEVFEGTQGGSDQGQGRTMWQPRPSDPELEAEMLRRLMLRFGIEESRAKVLIAEKAAPPRVTLGKSSDGTASLTIPDAFDRAWRRVGLSLDRIGFAVEDRDRAGGIYYVRYADPDANTRKDKSFLSKLAFWSGDDAKAKTLKYQVRLKAGGELTSVGVYMEDGKPANNETGSRILGLLHEQLK